MEFKMKLVKNWLLTNFIKIIHTAKVCAIFYITSKSRSGSGALLIIAYARCHRRCQLLKKAEPTADETGSFARGRVILNSWSEQRKKVAAS